MNILVVDPDLAHLNQLNQLLKTAYPKSNMIPFSDPLLAYRFGFLNPIDAIFTVDDMKRLDGLELTKMLSKCHPKLKACFITQKEHMHSHLFLEMAHYICKPVTLSSILKIHFIDELE